MSKEKVIDISTRKTGKIVGICAAAVAAIIVVVSSVSIVPAGCTGVVTTFGKVSDTALNEGLHLKVPFAQRVTTVLSACSAALLVWSIPESIYVRREASCISSGDHTLSGSEDKRLKYATYLLVSLTAQVSEQGYTTPRRDISSTSPFG